MTVEYCRCVGLGFRVWEWMPSYEDPDGEWVFLGVQVILPQRLLLRANTETYKSLSGQYGACKMVEARL